MKNLYENDKSKKKNDKSKKKNFLLTFISIVLIKGIIINISRGLEHEV